MADFIFNVAKGKIRTYVDLGLSNDALIWVPIETSGLESDATLIEYDDLGTLLAASNNEQTTLGRKTATTVVGAEDAANDRWDGDMDDPSWSGAGGNAVSKLLLCYDNDTTGGTDSNIVPIAAWDWSVSTPAGVLSAVLPTGGVLRAA